MTTNMENFNNSRKLLVRSAIDCTVDAGNDDEESYDEVRVESF